MQENSRPARRRPAHPALTGLRRILRRGAARVSPEIQVALLLVSAALADYATGPAISPAPFYVLPVALAGWRRGWAAGTLTAVAAWLLNSVTEWAYRSPDVELRVMALNELLRLLVSILFALLSARLGRQKHQLTRQHRELARLHHELARDMEAARDLQQLLMAPPPEDPAIEIGLRLRPARILGGDTLDLVDTGNGQLAITLADVSGKGSRAALAGAVLLGLLEDAPARFESPAETLRYLNRRLVGRLPEEMFVTLFYGLLDRESGHLTYASGGHEPPLFVGGSGVTGELAVTGPALGVMPEADFEDRILRLSPGDLVFCYTDGITDMRQPDGERLGAEGLCRLVRDRAALPCDELVRSLDPGESREAPDDISLVAIRYRGRGTSTVVNHAGEVFRYSGIQVLGAPRTGRP